ncbi:MAG: 4Fe-4S binding protein [Candidatus Eisenbacteria bacterium]
MKRDIITIDEPRCTGCGLCIPNCPEGAIQVIDGKARLVSDLFCDGLGACVGHCPEDAITIEKREAKPYDEASVMANIIKAGPNVIAAHLKHLADHGQDEYLEQAKSFLKARRIAVPRDAGTAAGGSTALTEDNFPSCPGARMVDLREALAPSCPGARTGDVGKQSQLRQWPVQLQLLNPRAPYFKDADLLIAADCVPFSYPDFHDRFLKGKILIVFCPKLDQVDDLYVEKLAEIFKNNNIKSITTLHMEVPCCFGTTGVVEEALKRSGKPIPVDDYTISIKGDLIQEEEKHG